ncbi:MAG: hypothetical protein CMG32_07375 [Candidatus Marinimicrobia bacterium]|nr:hypothetical protein [Candidatus Neomarinimicrobiota bacterium]
MSTTKKNKHKHMGTHARPSIHIINKTDLIAPGELKKLKRLLPDCLFVSAKEKTGINNLKNKIKNTLGVSATLSNNVSLTTVRQQASLEGVFGYLKAGTRLLQNDGCSYELLSFELSSALDSLNSLLGITTPDKIINNIFKSFCVGK